MDALDNAALALRIAGSGASRPRAGGADVRGARPRRLRGAWRDERRRHALIAFLVAAAGRPVLCHEPLALDAITRDSVAGRRADPGAADGAARHPDVEEAGRR
jgi:hypothetical protein